MKWEIDLTQNGVGSITRDGVDISSEVLGCDVTCVPGKGVTLFLEIRADVKLTLEDPKVMYANVDQLDVMDTDPQATAATTETGAAQCNPRV